jgi:hypothetical protein
MKTMARFSKLQARLPFGTLESPGKIQIGKHHGTGNGTQVKGTVQRFALAMALKGGLCVRRRTRFYDFAHLPAGLKSMFFVKSLIAGRFNPPGWNEGWYVNCSCACTST